MHLYAELCVVVLPMCPSPRASFPYTRTPSFRCSLLQDAWCSSDYPHAAYSVFVYNSLVRLPRTQNVHKPAATAFLSHCIVQAKTCCATAVS